MIRGKVANEVKCVLSDQGPRTLEAIQQKVQQTLRLHQALGGEQTDGWQYLRNLNMVVIVAKEILNHFENFEEWQGALNRLVDIEILLTVIYDILEEIDKLRQLLRLFLFLILHVLLYLFNMCHSQPRQELPDGFHEVLPMFGEGGPGAVLNESRAHFVFKVGDDDVLRP